MYCTVSFLQDSMYERFQFGSIAEQQICLRDESDFLIEYLQSQSEEIATVEYLQQVARVRMDLDTAVTLIMEKLRTTGVHFCSVRIIVCNAFP